MLLHIIFRLGVLTEIFCVDLRRTVHSTSHEPPLIVPPRAVSVLSIRKFACSALQSSKNKAKKLKDKSEAKKSVLMDKKEAKEHIGALRRLQEKDPQFYEFLKEHDKELLEFDEEVMDDDVQTAAEEEEEVVADIAEHSDPEAANEEDPSKNVITSAMVDSWCNAICDEAKLGAVCSLLTALCSAYHYGDDNGDDPTAKFRTMSGSVFNKIMLFGLNEMDGIL